MCKPNLRVNGRNFEDLNAEEQGSFCAFLFALLKLNSYTPLDV